MELRSFLAASVVLIALVGASCGVAAPDAAATIDGRSIPAELVDRLSADEAFASLIGFQASDSEAVLSGSSARSVIDFLLRGETLAAFAEREGIDVEPDEDGLEATLDQLRQSGYSVKMEDLSSEAREVLSRFVAMDAALARAGGDLGQPSEADLRYAYRELAPTGTWEGRTCVTMIGGPPDAIEEAVDLADSGTALTDIPGEVDDIQVGLDAAVQCYSDAQLETLPGGLAADVSGAGIDELTGPIDVESPNGPLSVVFEVSYRGKLGFEQARGELETLVASSALAVRTARLAEVNPRYGGPVELQLVPGQVNPTTGQSGPPSLVAQVSRPQAPGAAPEVLSPEP